MASYSTLHPAPQTYLKGMRDECIRSGTIQAFFSFRGSSGISMRQVSVDTIVIPSGRVMQS